MLPPEQAAAEQELMRQHQAVINRMRKDFEEKLKGQVAIKWPQSASTTRPGGLSAALNEQIDRLQIQHETDLALLSAMTKITTQQEIAQVTATLRSKRQEKLTRLAQLKAQKAVTAATSPVAPQSVIALLQEQTTSVSNSVRAELSIIQEAQNDHEKAILGDNSLGDAAHSSSLPARLPWRERSTYLLRSLFQQCPCLK
jgi:hypothetical protein